MNICAKGEKIYLDANFLIYWFISKEPELKKRARCLLAEFLVNKNELYSSALVFDEAWWGIKNEYNQQNCSNFPCSENPLFEELEKFTKVILLKIDMLQFRNIKSGIAEALSNMRSFGLRPRDAFHLATMRDNSVNIIATNDNDFIEKESLINITVLSIF